MDSIVDDRLKGELESFQKLWQGGYFEGQPLDPLGPSAYAQLGFISILHATYLRCIKPYVTSRTIALELGPGRGAWTKCLLPAKEVYALDALSAEHNGFFQYLGSSGIKPQNVKYFQVHDFLCKDLPENHFDFLFSHGCLCHVSFDGIRQYARNINPKLRSGSNCFWMIADYEKYNAAYANLSIWNALDKAVPPQGKPLVAQLKQMMDKVHHISLGEDDVPSPGRWYHAGTRRTCEMLQEVGYEIVDPDVGTNLRDPIIHFRKR
jgi:hypothetical protein